MTNEQPTETPTQPPMNPLRCITGAAISGGMGYALYSVLISIATNFAQRPVHSDNQLVVNLTSVVRTFVLGIVTLGTGIFGIVALGLLALAVQLFLQQLIKPKTN